MNGERILTRHVLRRSKARGTGGDQPPRPHEDECMSIFIPRNKLRIRTLHSMATKKAHERTMAAHGLWTLKSRALRM